MLLLASSLALRLSLSLLYCFYSTIPRALILRSCSSSR